MIGFLVWFFGTYFLCFILAYFVTFILVKFNLIHSGWKELFPSSWTK